MRKMGLIVAFIVMLGCSVFAAGQNTAFSTGKKKGPETGIKAGEAGICLLLNYGIPSGDVANILNSTLGFCFAGIFRNVLVNDFSLKLEGDYNQYFGKFDSNEFIRVVEAKLLGRYDILIPEMPGVLFLEAGGGAAFETISVAGFSGDNIDPVYCFGAGYELNISDTLTFLGIASYSIIPEKYISGAAKDGGFIKLYAGINYIIGAENNGRGGRRR
ncbi:MAG: hypothetical protein V1662_06375 [Candidatus Omnitrophota bacterium]